ncbi:MAG: hypothetical protein N2C12_01560, partial [Planctomycetales bacterium]
MLPYQLRTARTPVIRHRLFSCLVGLVLGLAALAQTSDAAPLPDAPERMYVPIDQFQSILHRDAKGVLLDRSEFESLWKQARKNQTAGPDQSAALVITGANYKAEIQDHSLVMTATVSLRQFQVGWHSVPLSFNNIAIEEALLGDQPAQLGRDSKGQLRFFHAQPGSFDLTLKLVTKLAAVGSDQLASFQLISGPPSSLSVTTPAGKHLMLEGRSLDRPAEINVPADYEFPVGGADAIQLQVTDRKKEATTDSLVFASSLIGV